VALTASLAACVIAVSVHYHVPASKLEASLYQPSPFPSVGAAHVPRGWLPMLQRNGFSPAKIQHDACSSVVAAGWILSYVTKVEDGWHQAQHKQLVLPAKARPWQPLIAYYSRLAHVDANLVNALILQESGFKAGVVSSAGAIGLMQITQGTAKALGVNPWNPAQNLWGGIWYLHNLLGAYHGNLALALAAYNAGPSAVNKYGGIPPYKETQHYIPTVLKNYRSLLASSSWYVAGKIYALD
jgi:soluble lytic murein transglycosylase-like protein